MNASRALRLLAAALCAGAAAHAEEPAPGGGGALRISADPPRLVLGTDPGAELRVAAPPAVEELSVTASAGRIENLRRLPGGGFSARFHPPAEQVPRVAIVAAAAQTAEGLADGWIAIPLTGHGDARVRGEPGASVTLRIGDRTFGPRTVGPDGTAVIPVIVPPGVREAHQGFQPIELNVPETSLLHAIQDRTTVAAEREERVRVVAYVVAPHGAARRGELPVFEPSRGTVSFHEREPGAFAAVWSLPPGPVGEERLVVRLPGAPASKAVLRVETVAGRPAVASAGPPALALSPRVGFAAATRGRFRALEVGLALKRRSEPGAAPRTEGFWRVDLEALGRRGQDDRAALLAGAGVRARMGGGIEGEGVAEAGALFGAGGHPALRLALSLGFTRSWGVPFVEASLLGATGGAPGAFAALGLSAGVWFGQEAHRGNDPDRR